MSDTHQPPAAPLPPQDALTSQQPSGTEAQASAPLASDAAPAIDTPVPTGAAVEQAAGAAQAAETAQEAHADTGPAPALPSTLDAPAAGSSPAPTPGPALAELSPAQCSARLAELFPALFARHQPQPLKLRIQADIQARAPGVFTRKSLSAFLHRYTTGTPYLQALMRSPQRVDLDGQPAGEIADEHREAATQEVARRRALMDERRAAEQAARRDADMAARQQREADQQGRRERASLLRAFETSTLTRANFCALKGIADTELDAQLALARQEAAERPAWPVADERAARRPEGSGDGRTGGRGMGPAGAGGHGDPRGNQRPAPRGPRPGGRPDSRPADRRPPGPDGTGAERQGSAGPSGAVTPGDRPAGGPGNRPRRPRPGP